MSHRFIVIIVLLLAACAHTKRSVAPLPDNAFFKEYHFEKTGDEADPLITLWKRQVSWPAYDKIIVEPVLMDATADSRLARIAHADRIQLQEFIEVHLREAMQRSHLLVNHPGEGTLRVLLTITDSDTQNHLNSLFRGIHLPATMLNALDGLLAGAGLDAAKANIKAEITDSTTGDLLLAAANANEDEPWEITDFIGSDNQKQGKAWVERFRLAFCRHQGRIDCEVEVPAEK